MKNKSLALKSRTHTKPLWLVSPRLSRRSLIFDQKYLKSAIIASLLKSTLGFCDGFLPTLVEWQNAAQHAAKSPATWLPLSGALILVATDSDQHISDWGSDKQPVFGSNKNANNAADGLTVALAVTALSSVLLSPQQIPDQEWVDEKAERIGLLLLAVGSAGVTAESTKLITRRERPNDPTGKQDFSFPSGHATESFALAAETVRNIDDFSLSEREQTVWRTGIYTMAGSVAWARVEANEHYTTDVLVGAALGNFIALTINNAFIGPAAENSTFLRIMPIQNGAALEISSSL